uniref:SLBB domain-containing protein n=1 Tax=Strongyloides papillosus TaxID=174720 RepID=A0A0N5BMW3_STREA
MFLKIFTTFIIILIYKISISYTYRTIIVPQGLYISVFGNVTWNDEDINSVKAALNNTKHPEKSDVRDVTKNKEFFLSLYAGGSDYDIGK